jgi:hypothetical protein
MMTDLTVSQAAEAWNQLQDAVRSQVPKESQTTPLLRWLKSGHLLLIGPVQVQARFVAKEHQYEIRFERFGAEQGHANFEATPGLVTKGPEVWKLKPTAGKLEVFWTIDNGPEVKLPNGMARRIVDHLGDYYRAYQLAPLGIH